ncbi:MAG: HAD-IIIC family phosphatase [Pseudomonadota bacterium]|jgi:FkbH-like protein|nr:HAD-IIIC family phosphatase [Pseudomonadota bacterium]
MKLSDAIKIQRGANAIAPPYKVLLACGFTPLHLQTFFHAHLQQLLPEHRVELQTGLFGDLVGTLRAALADSVQAIALVIEWTDLDPRLGYREAHSWSARDSEQIVANCAHTLDRLAATIESVGHGRKVAVVTPTLALSPTFDAALWCSAPAALRLKNYVAAFETRVNAMPNLALLDTARLAQYSPAAQRYDANSDLYVGFPYTRSHADVIAEALARILVPAARKKGLITDLDHTLWHGILGDVGAAGLQWDLPSHQQHHGLYQTLLQALADSGVLIAVASKNDPEAVQEALQRPDLRISPTALFPVEAHWHPKSQSVSRILQSWNISADAVVFVDDSAHELAEVATAHPAIHCLQFPWNDMERSISLLHEIRDLFAKERTSHEDMIRIQSVRENAAFNDTLRAHAADSESFLAGLDARIDIDFSPAANDGRALELVNKTNQFNLNGRRFLEAEWNERARKADTWIAGVSYIDRFGPLGKIAVLQGRQTLDGLHVDTWVMSCRAFSRRIEFACVQVLIEHFNVVELSFALSKTPKNAPIRTFFSLFSARDAGLHLVVTREQFEQVCPKLYQRINVVPGVINA